MPNVQLLTASRSPSCIVLCRKSNVRGFPYLYDAPPTKYTGCEVMSLHLYPSCDSNIFSSFYTVYTVQRDELVAVIVESW